MLNKVYKNQENKPLRRNKYFSTSFDEINYLKTKIVIKNYVIDPDTKTIR